MKRSSGSRKTADLSKSILQQLNMYRRAAGAAGVGLLALSQSAAAKIAYTPANVSFGLNQHGRYPIDLNHDGITDLTLSFFQNVRSSRSTSLMREFTPRGNSVWRVAFASRLANCTKPGSIIGRDRLFGSVSLYVGDVEHTSGLGKFFYGGLCEKDGKGVKNGFLGVRFTINGEPHFGWVRLTLMGGHPFKAKLTGYAYETIPNKAIIAGKQRSDDSVERPDAALTTPTPGSATLGALALGAPGLSIWRRDEPANGGS